MILAALSLALAAVIPSPAPPASVEGAGPAYDARGRRDPFVRPGSGEGRRTCPGEGLRSLRVEEAAVRGIARTRGGRFVLLADGAARSFIARAGDRLCDGVVEAVEAGAVTLVLEVDDPLLPARERRIVRALR